MTLFGHTFDTQQIVALIGLMLTLTLWSMAWKGERNWARWFRGWEAERKARREAEIRAENGDPDSSPPSDRPSGPWG